MAYSSDEGVNWRKAEIQMVWIRCLVFAVSSRVAQQKTLMAATLDHVFYGAMIGKNWYAVTTGLENFEVTALTWTEDENVLTGTTNGIYHSPDRGQSWSLTHGSAGYEVGALTYLPDGTALAALKVEDYSTRRIKRSRGISLKVYQQI